jgi:hypothetical protein
MIRASLISVVGVLVMLGTGSASAASYPPRVGEPHPDVLLPNIEDRAPVSLAQFRGRKVLLIQFASW